MRRESIKKRLKKAESRLDLVDNRFFICWREAGDDTVDWHLPNGSVERITEAEFKARGGILLTWDDIERDK